MLFTACFSGNHQEKKSRWYNEQSITLQNVNGIHMLGNAPFTGTVYSLTPETKDTIAVGSFLNGLEDGEWRQYFSNRQLMERRYYTGGKKTGQYEGWWPNGTRRLLYHFRNGEYHDNCSDWNDKGTLVKSMNYAYGYESGLQQQFYDNGKVKANYVMIDGRRYGLLGTKNCVNVTDSVFKK
jgi:antitoxin component YwqK of YwqJK toxin-antitoxin module